MMVFLLLLAIILALLGFTTTAKFLLIFALILAIFALLGMNGRI